MSDVNVLEKILEEIGVAEGIRFSRYTELLIAVKDVEKIIRSYMDEMDKTIFKFDFNRVKSFDCQCGRHYVNTYNGGWIPVEERLPNKNRVYNVTRLVNDAFISDSAYFDGQDTWHNDNRVNHTRPYLTDIVAWQPLPEPYKED